MYKVEHFSAAVLISLMFKTPLTKKKKSGNGKFWRMHIKILLAAMEWNWWPELFRYHADCRRVVSYL